MTHLSWPGKERGQWSVSSLREKTGMNLEERDGCVCISPLPVSSSVAVTMDCWRGSAKKASLGHQGISLHARESSFYGWMCCVLEKTNVAFFRTVFSGEWFLLRVLPALTVRVWSRGRFVAGAAGLASLHVPWGKSCAACPCQDSGDVPSGVAGHAVLIQVGQLSRNLRTFKIVLLCWWCSFESPL